MSFVNNTSSMGPSAFSHDGKYYSQIGGDGRCKIWETGTSQLKQEFTPDLHLSAPLSCLNWIQLERGTSIPKWKNRKRKSSLPNDETDDNTKSNECIVFGTTSGKLLLYSLNHAKVESVLEDAKSSDSDQEITCMEWNKKTGLYTCSMDSTLREWSIEDGSVRSKFRLSKHDKESLNNKTTAIRVFLHQTVGGSPHKILVTASCQLVVWSLESQTVLRRMVGHAGEVAHLYIVPVTNEDKFYVLSGSKSDRILSFWNVQISSDDLSQCVDQNDKSIQEYKKTKRRSRTKSGEDAANKSQELTEACCNFLMEDCAKQVCCAALDSSSSSLISLAAVTRRGVLHYYQHTLNGHSVKPVKPSTTIQVVSEEQGSVRLSPSVCATLLGDHLLVGYTTSMGIVFERVTPDISEKTQVLIRTSANNITKKEKTQKQNEDITRIRVGQEEGAVYLTTHVGEGKVHSRRGKVDVPMELRLANLSIAQQGGRQAAETPSNMAQLLVQALHSKDNKLLQTVFECKDPAVAYNTLNRLPIQYLPRLLDHLTNMMAKRTNQCKSACVWTAALCKARGSVLLGHEQSIRPLVAALRARAPHLPHLLALKGRLTLLTDRQETEEEHKPVLEYKDSSSEDEAVEDDMDGLLNTAGEDSALSWNEDEDESEDGVSSDQENMSE